MTDAAETTPHPETPEAEGSSAAEAAIRAAFEGAELVDFGDHLPREGGGDEVIRRCIGLPPNDVGNGRRLIRHFGTRLLWVPGMGWLAWDGRRWSPRDGELKAQTFAQRLGRLIQREAAVMEDEGPLPDESDEAFAKRIERRRAWAVTSGNSNRVQAALTEARPFLTASPDDLDAVDFVVACENASLDLGYEAGAPEQGLMPEATVTPRPHDRADRVTRLVPVVYDPDARAPAWERFMAQVQPDPECRAFLQRWAGYCLTGSVAEQVIVCNFGLGSNGKSVFQDILQEVLGDLSQPLPFESFVHDDRRRGGEATPDLAELPGKRLAIASEPEHGAKLSEGLVKRLASGERLMVRRLNRDPFSFQPRFKVMLSFNEKPRVSGQDYGIWRRILLLPWPARFVGPDEPTKPGDLPKDPTLKDKLRRELPGILNWVLAGYADWRCGGLRPPDAVREAVAEYKSESNPIAEFVREALVEAPPPDNRIQATPLFEAYERWCRAQPLDPLSKTAFGKRLSAMGLRKETCGVVYYVGYRWRDEFEFKNAAGGGGEPSNYP